MTSVSAFNISVESVPLSSNIQLLKETTAKHSAVSRVGHLIIAFGKFLDNRRGQPTQLIGVLDLLKKEWRWINTGTDLFETPRAFLYNDGLYVCSPSPVQKMRGIGMFHLDLVSEELTESPCTGESPSRRRFFAGNYLERIERFVVFGGSSVETDAKHNSVHILTMPRCRWVQPVVKGKPPEARMLVGSCVYEDVIYYFGGHTGQNFCHDGLFLLSMSQNNKVSWSYVKTNAEKFPPLARFSFAPFHGKLLLCGGSSPRGVLGIHMYDPRTRRFAKIGVPPTLVIKVGSGSAAFKLEDQRSIGIFGGDNSYAHYVRISLDA